MTLRPNERTLPKPYRDPISGKWVAVLPDSGQQDIIVVDVTLRHREGYGDLGHELQRAGAIYQYISSGIEYEMKFNPDELVSEQVAKMAEKATNLLLDWRRDNHEHTHVVLGE